MQALLTSGLAHEKSNRATDMIYTNMLWALLMDKLVFGMVPGWSSVFGSVLILGSAIFGFAAGGKGVEAGNNTDEADDEGGSEEQILLNDIEV